MSLLVLDASVVVKWFHPQQPHQVQAEAVRRDFGAGTIRVSVPSLLYIEVINAAARRWRWSAERVHDLATDLGELRFEVVEPEVATVARWASAGLSAYDAAYVAVAERAAARLLTDDAAIVQVAPEIARPLASYV